MSCAKSELCIFDSAMPQIVVENACFEEIFPLNTITGSSPADIEFNIVGSDMDYLDLNDTLLYISVKVAKKDGTDLIADADVTPSNYMLHTLFKDVILSLNTIKIEGGNSVYTHKALIETILNYGNDTKENSLTAIGYDNDPAKRKKWIEKSKVFTMCGSIQLDFLDQPKYLIPGVNVHLRLIRNKDSMVLTTSAAIAGDVKLMINEAKLFVRRVKVEPSVLMGHQLGLNTRNAIYPIRKTELVAYSLATGTSAFYKDQIFGDMRLPKFVLITFQNTDIFNGKMTEKTSIYKHFDVTNITLTNVNGFRESYSQDFKEDKCITTYVTSIIRNMGLLDKSLNNGISYQKFKEQYPFFTFVLAPDFDVHQCQIPKQGNLRLDIKFGTALPASVSILIYGVFDSEIQINKNRTIFI